MSGVFPDRLWQPTAKDLQAQFAPESFFIRSELLTELANQSTVIEAGIRPAAAGVIPGITDQDHVVILTHVHGLASGTGGQTATQVAIRVEDLNSGAVYAQLAFNNNDNTPGAIITTSWQGELVLMPGIDRMVCQAFFSAGVANNATTFDAAGFIIPRGNWQIGRRERVSL